MAGKTSDPFAILSVEEMYRADAIAIGQGIPGETLMERAGAAIAREIRNRWSVRPVVVLCGPGNNGGDGFVVARLLACAGWDVNLALLGDRNALKGDAALNADRWDGAVQPVSPGILDGAGLVVDALFGAGLARPLEDLLIHVAEAINSSDIPCVAVDVPSGVHGDTGHVFGVAPRADLTVTFFRPKPAHLLYPGRGLAGDLVVADIGIPDEALAEIAPRTFRNDPGLWRDAFPWPRAEDHKYSRGHALVAGGEVMTGAARLAARAAARIGAGMVTIACKPGSRPIYAADMPSFLVRSFDDPGGFAALFDDDRINAALVGPGAGVSGETREMALAPLRAGRATVLDADAITAFADDPSDLFALTKGANCVLTPHEGEFARIYGHEGDKLSRARAAARECGAVVLLKGPDTVIAAPDGRAVINANAPPALATAGAGDVLAGLIVGLAALHMDIFSAACAAAWIHGEAATAFGPGLVAGDLPDGVPEILTGLKDYSK